MDILSKILDFLKYLLFSHASPKLRKPREPRMVEQTVPTTIKVQIDLARIHDKRHQGRGFYFGYSWEENAAIGIMNNLVAAGIPMDWKHFITWVPAKGLRDALAFERIRPTRGTLRAHRHFHEREVVCVTWTDA